MRYWCSFLCFQQIDMKILVWSLQVYFPFMDIVILQFLKKLAFAVKSIFTYSWGPYRPDDFFVPIGLPTQFIKSPYLSIEIPQ
jgi:hypothetical protein